MVNYHACFEFFNYFAYYHLKHSLNTPHSVGLTRSSDIFLNIVQIILFHFKQIYSTLIGASGVAVGYFILFFLFTLSILLICGRLAGG